ncbi:OmpP1/FadL family transporter [Billgrantia kenyensis]|uniref:MtrB/PioB family outer membrane beta-barrel protein n=1 Tax=Billgrantia kenyensis TaxID=321266 RepID=A0A7V9VZI0_9GAMM|nr:outer membrane protein transport protein [Halomonas kenyensis]MBA2778187.1 outer membrane protein transport protein [Halomonas kenyensis]MCG6661034.1 MtrB/PioB family outer membrane beta-barrel protein [Halomonas kenyensis]
MQNKFNRITWAVAIAAAAFASQANAGGYQINEQSVSGQGYGHAGRSSNVNDATIVFGNPAGMSFLDRAQITVGGTYLNVNTDIDNATATRNGMPVHTDGTAEGDIVPGTLIPFAFYAHPVNEQLAFGFGVYVPFGSKTEYEDGFVGRNLGNYTELRVMSAQPTVSYRFNDQWSVGAGVTYNRVDGELHRQVPNSMDPATDLDARIEGDDDAWGYNLGVIFQPVPETTLGLTYRSKVDYTLTGDFRARTTNDMPPGVFGPGPVPAGTELSARDAQLDLTTPETINFSITQQMSDRLKLMAGASWVRWSRFDEIRVIDPNDPGGDPITLEQQDYSNAWAYALGGEYQLNPQLALRAGVTLDFTPTSDEFRSARIPSDDRRIFSVGAGWTPVDNLTLDLAYSYLTERSTHVDQERTDQGGAITSTYTADYKNEAHGFGAQLTYRF